MAITIDRLTDVISVPQGDLTHITGTLYELNTDWLRLQLKAIEANEEGIVFTDTHRHNTEVTVAGTTFARIIEILDPYSIEFTPNSQWSVRLAGSNNNIFDVENGILVQNQVQVIAQNSAGLIVGEGGGGDGFTEPEREQMRDALGIDGDKTTAVGGQLQRALGLTQENYRLSDTSYNGYGDLVQATCKIYPTAADLDADTNEVATYLITAVYDSENNLTSYQFKRTS